MFRCYFTFCCWLTKASYPPPPTVYLPTHCLGFTSLCLLPAESDHFSICLIAAEHKIRTFRSLLWWRMSLPERHWGGESVGRNPWWDSVVSGSPGWQKEQGAPECSRVPQASEQGSWLQSVNPGVDFQLSVAIKPQTPVCSGEPSPSRGLVSGKTLARPSLPWEEQHGLELQKSVKFGD